jgi:FdhE protein
VTSFDARSARAAELAAKYPAARELLNFYRELAIFQKSVFAELRSTEVRDLARHFPALAALVRRSGPKQLAGSGDRPLTADTLARCWEGRAEDPVEQFYARVLLQPFAESLATRGQIDTQTAQPTCPFCSARPVAAVLRGEGDGGKRWLLCSVCSTEWQFRRVVCPACGEEDKEKLPVYTAAEFEHVRADACDSCKTFIKSIDLTRDGHAIPLVDEIATIALTLWAEDHGYSKIEPNLLGL